MDQTSESTKELMRKKYEEIIELLLGAGYFRARINTLSEFDKVVGGLCWLITSSGADVDVDILFQENSTIGQRIPLSEAIVKALRKMNCPAQIQPHQIQGGVGGTDFPALFPVIVWLVKKFFETRELREQQLRAFSVLQFSKNYQFPTESDKFTTSDSFNDILKRNKAVRQYKRAAGKRESEETRVHSCLMEYGELFGHNKSAGGKSSSSADASDMIAIESSEASGKTVIKLMASDATTAPGTDGKGKGAGGASVGLSMFDKRLAQAQKDAAREEQAQEEAEQRLEDELRKNMTGESNPNVAVSGSLVSGLVGLSSDEMSLAAAAYTAEMEDSRRKQGAGGSAAGGGKIGPQAAFKRHKATLLKEQAELEVKAVEVESDEADILARLALLAEEKDNTLEYTAKLQDMLAQQEELERQAKQQKELVLLRDLVGLNESYKGQEAAFKASCKVQMAELQAKIKEVEASTAAEGGEDDESRKLREIEGMHAKVLDKYSRLRQLLAAANLEVATSARIIDDVPTRTELIQYERRFVELYQQISWKLEETRKYYALYNTLETTLSFLQKEAKLLNAISDNFDDAMANAASKSEYLTQIGSIVKGVDDSLSKQEAVAQQKEQKLEEMKNTHQNVSRVGSGRCYVLFFISSMYCLCVVCSLWMSNAGTLKRSRTSRRSVPRTSGSVASSRSSGRRSRAQLIGWLIG
jgi:hypothetical protein